jgi:hypothetical protein
MQLYDKFAPTGFDPKGLALYDQQDWLVAPCGRNRDSGLLDRSNFKALENLLEATPNEDWELHRFGHWACGWFEIIIVRPGSPAETIAREVESALDNYPVLNDEDYSTAVYEAESEYWCGLSIGDRVQLIQRRDRWLGACSVFAARRDEVPEGIEFSFLRE